MRLYVAWPARPAQRGPHNAKLWAWFQLVRSTPVSVREHSPGVKNYI